MASDIDTSYRVWDDADLQALKLSCLTQLIAIQGVGQSHTLNNRSTSLADFEKLNKILRNVNAAIAWRAQMANDGNKGFASRYTDFRGCGYDY